MPKCGGLGVFVSKQTGNWTDASSWLSGLLPLSNDNVTINTGHTLTIPNGQIASAGVLNDGGILNNFGTLNMGKIPSADLYAQTFKYHIRGGLKGINLDANNDLTNTLFSYKLAYEDGTNGGYFDGNIRNQYWKSNIDGIQRAYEYSYDGASRITQGVYASTKAEKNYALNAVSYDFNGNITALSRNGLKSNNSFGLIDDLAYTYQVNSNKIQEVTDKSLETTSFTDVTGSTDYTYSLDGSLTSDANKGISAIEYNYLKKPRRIVKNGVEILYQYDALGRKLKETVGTSITDYAGNTIFKNNVLYQIAHDEGRIINGEYEYHIKDHLGSLRVAFRDSSGIAKITQSNSYGIFGEELPSISYFKAQWKKDEFRFTGKENLPETGYTDFGARFYDNIVPRFITIDPLSELNRRFSPTVYGNANPLRFIDPDGMESQEIKDFNGRTHTVGDDDKTTIYQASSDDDKDKGKNSLGNSSQSGIAVGSVGGMTTQEATAQQEKAKPRPDTDRKLTYLEASNWSHYGEGKELKIDASTIDLSKVYSDEIPYKSSGKSLRVNLYSPSRMADLGQTITFGNILLVKDNLGRVQIYQDKYDFEVGGTAHPWTGPNSQAGRNLLTILGIPINGGQGKMYPITFNGFAKVSPGSPPKPVEMVP